MTIAPAKRPLIPAYTEPRWPMASHEEIEATETGLILVKLYAANRRLLSAREYDPEETDALIERLNEALSVARAIFYRPMHARRG